MRLYVHNGEERLVFSSEKSFELARASNAFPKTALYWKAGMQTWMPVATYGTAAPLEPKHEKVTLASRPGAGVKALTCLMLAWPFLLTLPWGWSGLALGGMAYALGLLIFRSSLSSQAKLFGSLAGGLAAFMVCLLLDVNKGINERGRADLVQGVRWEDQFDGGLNVQSITWETDRKQEAHPPLPSLSGTSNPDHHRLDLNGDSWPDSWPNHWREDGLSIDFAQATDAHLADVYNVLLLSKGPEGETAQARLLRLGSHSTDRKTMQNGKTRLPTAEIIPVDNHWLTLGAAQAASEQLKEIAGIESVVLRSIDLGITAFGKEPVNLTNISPMLHSLFPMAQTANNVNFSSSGAHDPIFTPPLEPHLSNVLY